MSILKIPGYFYFGSETIQSSLNFYKSTRLQEMATQGINYTVTGSEAAAIVNPCAFVNEYLGEDLLSPLKENLNIALLSGEGTNNWVGTCMKRCYLTNTKEMYPANNTNVATKFATLNNKEFSGSDLVPLIACGHRTDDQLYTYTFSAYSQQRVILQDHNTEIDIIIEVPIWPDDMFVDNVLNPDIGNTIPRIRIDIALNTDLKTIILVRIKSNTVSSQKDKFEGFTLDGSGSTDEDTNNPYGTDPAGPGGGDGDGIDPNETDPVDVPSEPGVNAAELGFITIYNPSKSQLQALANFMWSSAFDLDTYKKLFSDPMQSIIGLAIVPIAPSTAGSKNVHFGTIDSGIGMPYLSTNFVKLDCGSVKISKDVGSFLDASPYTKVSLYLPYIGIRDLSADDVAGHTINVQYWVDVLTGACAAFVKVSGRGVMYSYNGSCITNVPLTAVNFSGAIQNAVSAIASGITTAVGMATGTAPLTAGGVMGLINSAANTALNSKPQIQRSGNLGGSAGIMSIQKPYVIIERPNVSVPNYVEKYVGQASNITRSLGSCSGFTVCEYLHLDGITATTGEISEIEALLKGGVIL